MADRGPSRARRVIASIHTDFASPQLADGILPVSAANFGSRDPMK
jgi:hypothetical protein